MIVLGIPVLALLLLSQPGGSIVCYYCPEETLSAVCTETKNCTNMDACKTTVLSPYVGFPFQGNEVVIRGCAMLKTCVPSDLEELGNSRITFCCNIDQCNNRGINATVAWTEDSSAVTQTSATTGVFLLLGISVLLIVMRQ